MVVEEGGGYCSRWGARPCMLLQMQPAVRFVVCRTEMHLVWGSHVVAAVVERWLLEKPETVWRGKEVIVRTLATLPCRLVFRKRTCVLESLYLLFTYINIFLFPFCGLHNIPCCSTFYNESDVMQRENIGTEIWRFRCSDFIAPIGKIKCQEINFFTLLTPK